MYLLVLRMACGVRIYAGQPKDELCVTLIAGCCLKGVACSCFASLSNCFQGYQRGRGIQTTVPEYLGDLPKTFCGRTNDSDAVQRIKFVMASARK